MAVLMLLFIRSPIPPPSDALFFPIHVYPFILTIPLSFKLVSVIANMSQCVSNRISLILFVLDLIPLALEYVIFNIFEVCCLFDLCPYFFLIFTVFYNVAVEIICVNVLIMVVSNMSLIVRSYHVTYAFQSESTLYSCLSVLIPPSIVASSFCCCCCFVNCISLF